MPLCQQGFRPRGYPVVVVLACFGFYGDLTYVFCPTTNTDCTLYPGLPQLELPLSEDFFKAHSIGLRYYLSCRTRGNHRSPSPAVPYSSYGGGQYPPKEVSNKGQIFTSCLGVKYRHNSKYDTQDNPHKDQTYPDIF